MEKLHTGAKWLFRLRGYSSIFIFFWIFLWFYQLNIMGYFFIFLLLFIILLALLSEVYARLSYRFWGYEFTKNELKIEKGIIWKTYKSIPYGRIQNIDIKRGIIARMLGFSTLEIQTAGYSAVQSGGNRYGTHSEGYLPAVSIDAAEKIRNFIMGKIGNKKQGL